ncbi:ac57 [Malacosoma neustria nucleopolyhedrovirus]|uniref:ac57 n=1 Tax=Malacosoma neustria nuclear polyhedrosis virus TaxID=38012 RepID=UPI000E35BCB5|nr:ac57 [Malacosoma neustria nucleopolyhedrovirus]AUF81572.1 ac57 [Malacosoma neustria nucleopolyhedrovirus]
MMSSLSFRLIEFENVCIDLRYLTFSKDDDCIDNNKEYIIFLNVKKAFYSNFNITTDMSLETLTMYIYENLQHRVDGERVMLRGNPFERIFINERDRNQSTVIEISDQARIIVANKLHPDEKYHQRITGYMDFEKRHEPPPSIIDADNKILAKHERDELNREYEMKILFYNLN